MTNQRQMIKAAPSHLSSEAGIRALGTDEVKLYPGVSHSQNTIKITCTKHTQKSFSNDTNHILVLSALTDKLSLIVPCIFLQTAYFSTWTKVSCSHTSCPCPQVLFCMGRKMDMIYFYSLSPTSPSPPPVFRTPVLNKACNSKLKCNVPSSYPLVHSMAHTHSNESGSEMNLLV